ncbi:MAG: C1q-like domain-containing protein [Polyangiaceae bacterium]
MKIKVVVVDLEIPPRTKKWGLRIGIPAVVLLAGGAIAYAAGMVTWSSGQTLTASDLNNNFSYLQGEIAALQGQAHPASGFRATLTTPTSVPQGNGTQVPFNNELFDLGDEYNATTGVFTPKNAGIYLVMCALQYEGQAPGAAGGWDVHIADGTNEIIRTDVPVGPQGSVETAVLTQLAAGDAVSCVTYQTTSGSQALNVALADGDTFSAARLY